MKKQPTEADLETGERIREMRETLGITGRELADRIGVTRGAVGNWELGQGIKRENLQKIASAYKVSFEWLALNRGPMRADEDEPDSASIEGKLYALQKVFGRPKETVDRLRDQIDALIDLEKPRR